MDSHRIIGIMVTSGELLVTSMLLQVSTVKWSVTGNTQWPVRGGVARPASACFFSVCKDTPPPTLDSRSDVGEMHLCF